ncbi:unnamed protein product [Polarella glacialis]|uniref:BTB domain-containing protein n=1 Tax=Polarella glacialis TaxID=89957 RepID=A0A813GRH8_POLGL|nr:unnamed protein product [Polarella glacialis]
MSGSGFLRPSLVPCRSWQGWNRKQRWGGMAVGSNGDVYCCPQDAEDLLVIQPKTRDIKHIKLPYLFRNVQLDGMAVAPDGRLYFSPIVRSRELYEPYEGFFEALEENVESHEEILRNYPFRDVDGYDCLWRACVLTFDTVSESYSHFVQKLDPSDIEDAFECSFSSGLFGGMAAAGNGKLYCPPTNASAVAVVDPASKQISFIMGAGRNTQQDKWAGIALAENGLLYCAPARARSVLVINPADDTLDFITDQTVFDECGVVRYPLFDFIDGDEPLWDYEADDIHCWSGIAMADNGKLFCAPQDANAVLVIDPDTWALSFIPLAPLHLGTLKDKWAGIVKAADGRLYCAPWCVDCVLVIDPRFATLSLIPFLFWDVRAEHGLCQWFKADPAAYVPRECYWQWCGIAASEGRIWCAPDRADEVLTLLLPKDNLISLLRSGYHFDLTVTSESGGHVRCHQSVIGSASRVLDTMLAGDFREGQEGRICLREVSPATVTHFVEHIYSGLLPRGADVKELAELAHQYELDQLLGQCLQDALPSSLNEASVADAARFFKRHSTASFEALELWHTFKYAVSRDEGLCSSVVEALGSSGCR